MMLALAIAIALVPALLGCLPLAVWIARGRARREGIDLPSAAGLRRARDVDLVLLDRWGTVTTGELRVSAIESFDPDDERNLRWFAGALGHAAEDPVARAVARLSARGKLTSVQRHAGDGISGSVDRHPVRLGRPEWLGMPTREAVGVTVGVQVDARPIGYITVEDDVRPDARTGVERLRAAGVAAVLVSDDSERNTRHLAEACGIDEWHAGIARERRDQLVADYRLRGHVVAFATSTTTSGDLPLSDSTEPPGTSEPAGIRLADLDINRIATAISLSRSTARTTTRARRTGAAVTVLGVGVAAWGVLPALAVAAIGCVAVLAIASKPGYDTSRRNSSVTSTSSA
jgi:cation transport ATPase